jgi:hypothetical protein
MTSRATIATTCFLNILCNVVGCTLGVQKDLKLLQSFATETAPTKFFFNVSQFVEIEELLIGVL